MSVMGTLNRLNRWQIAIVVVAIVNFTSFFLLDSYFGGDALNGMKKEGHYFLGGHGTFTEVSRNIFLYSKIHAISMIITHLLAFAVLFDDYVKQKAIPVD